MTEDRDLPEGPREGVYWCRDQSPRDGGARPALCAHEPEGT